MSPETSPPGSQTVHQEELVYKMDGHSLAYKMWYFNGETPGEFYYEGCYSLSIDGQPVFDQQFTALGSLPPSQHEAAETLDGWLKQRARA